MEKSMFNKPDIIKAEVIRLSTALGFKSKFFHHEPLEYSYKENDRWYLYMCEIMKWLEDKHPTAHYILAFPIDGVKHYSPTNSQILPSDHPIYYESYDESLKHYIYNELILIKK